jgi:hypothetical protein
LENPSSSTNSCRARLVAGGYLIGCDVSGLLKAITKNKPITEMQLDNILILQKKQYADKIPKQLIINSSMFTELFEPCLNRQKTARPQIALRP